MARRKNYRVEGDDDDTQVREYKLCKIQTENEIDFISIHFTMSCFKLQIKINI